MSLASPFSSSTESLIEFSVDYEQDTPTAPQSPEDRAPVYHQDLPVYATDAKPIDCQRALANAVSCPQKFLGRVPPTMVTDNYCFVIDGDAVAMNELTGNIKQEQWWKPTGKSIRYYWSQSLKEFYKVNILLAKGKVISARHRRRRPSTGFFFDRQVSLKEVFQVSRYYYYWRTSLHFHRIISIVAPIEKVGEETVGFKRRIFVQYLWRDARESEKLRVSYEYEMVMAGKPISAPPGGPQRQQSPLSRRSTLGTSSSKTVSRETLLLPSLHLQSPRSHNPPGSSRLQYRRGTLGPSTSGEMLQLQTRRGSEQRSIKQSLSSTGITRYL